jgi:hypothetical protein
LDLLAPGVATDFHIPNEMTADPGPAKIREVNIESADFKRLMTEILVGCRIVTANRLNSFVTVFDKCTLAFKRLQEQPVYGLGGAITIAFSPSEFRSKTHFLRLKKREWGANTTPAKMKAFIEDSEKMCGTAFKTITGNNRRVIKELVRKETEDEVILASRKANERFFTLTNCKLAFGLPLEIQRWYADFDNKSTKIVVRDTPYDRCKVLLSIYFH